MVTSVDIVSPERTFVDGDIVRNKCWVGLVKLSEGQNIVECCCDLKIIDLQESRTFDESVTLMILSPCR